MFSVLSSRVEAAAEEPNSDQPSCFHDLNLDQVVDRLTAGKKEYHLEPFFYTPLRNQNEAIYRHEVFQDLEKQHLFAAVTSFAAEMRVMRRYVSFAEKLEYRYEKKRWLLEGIDVYCRAVSALAGELLDADIGSRGLAALRDHVRYHVQSGSFRCLRAEAADLKEELSKIRYCLLIDGLAVKVRRYASEQDYAPEVEHTFAKFRHDSQKSYLVDIRSPANLNHVEAKVLDCVARLFPEVFARLDGFCDENREFADAAIVAFDREVQFYVSYLELLSPLRKAGLGCCYPRLASSVPDTCNLEGYDLSLACKLVAEGGEVVCNDFHLSGEERVLVVTGPNQGGKTTFARAFGQLHYLAALGCPVPGREARLLLADNVFTHFGKQENLAELRGKLEDDLLRIHAILARSTPRSVIIMNEIFTSTTVQDAQLLSRNILKQIVENGSLAVLVTFLDELAAAGPHTVSMVAAVDPRDPMVRTFKVLRGPADGLAYALTMADRYRLSYESIKERIRT
jgi:DNA mismatch repair protein MutS